MPKILISYRRDDSDAITGRIRDRIAGHYGDDAVFMDIDNIPFGLDFRDQVQAALTENQIVLAIIGPKWMGPTRGGVLRIREETDPVRVEIETALMRGVPVIPVLVGRAAMPKAVDLPDGLKNLPFLNAAEVSAGRDFNQHIERLLRSIDLLVQHHSQDAPTKTIKTADQEAAEKLVTDKRGPKHSFPTSILQRLGLLFADQTAELAFRDSFRRKFYWVGQTSMMCGVIAWAIFGATDLLSGTAGLASVQFRFMLAMPLLLLFFGMSFTQLARRFWQAFFAAFAVVGISCMYIALILVGPQSWFRIEQATMSFMLFLAFVGVAPFTTAYALAVGLFVAVVHAAYLESDTHIDGIHVLFYSLFVGGSYVAACMAAWVRERHLRAEFVERAQANKA